MAGSLCRRLSYSLISSTRNIISPLLIRDVASECMQKRLLMKSYPATALPREAPYSSPEKSVHDELSQQITKDTISKVNEQVKKGEEGRLFAVVHVCGKQFKITAEDIVIVEGYWPPQNGDEIRLEKVLLVGGRDFTLVGRPILPLDLVSVKATVIEKELSHTKTVFYKRRRKQYMRTNFYRSQQTMLRINDIAVIGEVNNHLKEKNDM